MTSPTASQTFSRWPVSLRLALRLSAAIIIAVFLLGFGFATREVATAAQ